MPSTNSSLLFWQTREEVSIVLDAPFLFLWVTNNEIFAKILQSSSETPTRRRRKKQQQRQLQSFLRYTETQ